MHHLSDTEFADIVAAQLDALPERFVAPMSNVAVTYESDPSPEQRHKLALRGNQTLFGLYEGIPLTARDAGYSMVLPDKITLFKNPLLAASHNLEHLKENVRHTLWHEIAHHTGLDHARIDTLDEKRQVKKD